MKIKKDRKINEKKEWADDEHGKEKIKKKYGGMKIKKKRAIYQPFERRLISS